MAAGASVEALWVFPVKSMSGQLLDETVVGEQGLDGDRSYAVVDADGAPVTAAQEPRLRDATARIVDGQVRIQVPGHDGDVPADDAAAALSQWLGRDVRLQRSTGARFVDVAPVHLVSTRSTADPSHAEECDACSVSAPRANVVLALADVPSEREWVGRTVACGEVTLHVARRPDHCLGAYADVTTGGRLRVGDAVHLH